MKNLLSQSDAVVVSVNIMVLILVICVSIVIYYILRFDHFWPNEISHTPIHVDDAPSESRKSE